MLAQALAALTCVMVLLLSAYGGWPPDADAAMWLLLEINLDTSFLLTGATTLGALFLILPLVRWRVGRDFRQRLALTRPPARLLLLSAGALLPLAVLSKALYHTALDHWLRLVEQHSALAPLAQANTLEALHRQAQFEPLGILVIALALGPAIGEEVVFRGLIGPGLVRRWGVLLGVLLTSTLFAGVHGFPPHAVATFPLALFLHYTYLKTGSLWTPIALHFFNNALSVVLFKLPEAQQFPASPAVLLTAALYVAVISALLWGSGRGAGEPAVNPGRPGSARMRHALACVSILGFTTTFVWSVM